MPSNEHSKYGCLRCGKFLGYDTLVTGLWCTLGCKHADWKGEPPISEVQKEINYKESKNKRLESFRKRNESQTRKN